MALYCTCVVVQFHHSQHTFSIPNTLLCINCGVKQYTDWMSQGLTEAWEIMLNADWLRYRREPGRR